MATLIEPDYKNLVGERLTNRIGMALRSGEIEISDADRIITLILSVIEAMQYKEELIALFTKLSAGWPLFHDLLREDGVITQADIQHMTA